MRSPWWMGLFLIVAAVGIPLIAHPGEEPHYSFDHVKTSLAHIAISHGPETSKLTRSALSPQLYRNTVDAVPLIFLPGKTPETSVSGSGVVVTASGQVLTNWHVIRDSQYALVIFRPTPPKTMADLTPSDVWVARNLWTDAKKDLGLLQLLSPIDKTKSLDFTFLKFIPLEDPLRVGVGEDVFAIGHPQGSYWSYTEGVISQIRPSFIWKTGEDSFQATIVQTQTAISHGSSGGPLINKDGNLVGLLSTMITGQPGFDFAIAVHELQPLLLP
jgi:S1-C subfamily serine protease